MVETAVSKYTLTFEPALPAKCIGCNNDVKPDRPLVDTSASLDYYGAILICVDCIKDMAKLVDLVSNESLNLLRGENEELTFALTLAQQKVRALEDVVRTYGLGQFVIDDELDSDLVTSEGEKQNDGSPDENEPGLFK